MAPNRVRQILLEILAVDGSDDVPAENGELWARFCASATRAVPASGASVVLLTTNGQGGVLASTAGAATGLEEQQQLLGEGPGLTAFRDRRPDLQSDLGRAGAQWPGFVAAASAAGIEAMFAFPLQVGAIRFGVLDLYRDTAGSLDRAELTEALDHAAAATTILLGLQHDAAPGQLHPQLADRTDGHREIHQATGVVTVQASVTMNEALLLLRARAFADGRPMLELAKDVVARRVTFYPGDDNHE